MTGSGSRVERWHRRRVPVFGPEMVVRESSISRNVVERPVPQQQFVLDGFQILVRVVFSCAMTAVVAIGAFVVIRYLNAG